MSFNSYFTNLNVHHTRAFSMHGRPKQLSSMERLTDYSCSW